MPRIVDKDAKKKEILLAAMQVFARNGVVNTKMIDIATTAGIGKGTIYEYFRSKDEIFMAAFDYFFETMNEAVEMAVARESDPLKQLQGLVVASLQALLHAGDQFTQIMMDFWAEGVRTKNEQVLGTIDLKGIYTAYRKKIREILTLGVKTGVFKVVDTQAAASVLIGSLDGIMLQWIVDRKAVNLEKATKALLEIYIDGIRAN